MAIKYYGYYLKGNRFAIVQRDTSSTTSSEYGSFKSPTESVADGIEIEYTYSPTYNLNTTYTDDTDYFNFLGWGSDGTNLLLFTYNYTTVDDLSSKFSAGDNILIQNSSRWNGLHKVKSAGSATGILTLETLANLSPSKITTSTGASSGFAVTNTFKEKDSVMAAFIEFVELISSRATPTIFIENAANALNNGMFTFEDVGSGQITLKTKYTLAEFTDYTTIDPWGNTVAGLTDSVTIYNAYHEQLKVLKNIDVLNDESFELDINGYQSKAIVYYLKAKMAEDKMDIKSREFFMREFKRQVEKDVSSRKRGPSIIQGNSIMRQK